MAEICGAPRKRDGEPCEKPGTGTGGRCRLHGGASPVGPAHPRWKHGRTSQLYQKLPKHLRQVFQATIEDPKAFSLLNEVALLDSRAADLLGKLDLHESADAWAAVRRAADDAQEIIEQVHGPDELDDQQWNALKARVRRLNELALNGVGDGRTWDELYSLFIVRGKMVDAETRRAANDDLSLDKAQVVALVGWIVHALMRHVKDREALEKVMAEVEKLVGPMEESGGQEVALIEAG